jgi:glycosyltransferase involved in cell wall biosynthesis
MSIKASRILFTATYSQPYLSGITDYIATITEFLAKTHQVTLASFQHDHQLALNETTHGVVQVRFPVHLKLSKGFINFFYPWKIFQLVAQHDHVFINAPQVEGIFVALAAKLLKKRLTIIYHCELFFESGLLLKTIALIANFLSWLIVGLSDEVVVYTDDYAQASPVLKTWLKKVTAVPPPILLVKKDLSFETKLKALQKTSTPIVGFSGRVSIEKGLDYLLDAIEFLQPELPHIRLICAGPYGSDVAGEKTYFESLQKKITARNLPVTFLGRLSKPQLRAFYENISVLVLPSINKTEAFGMVQAEALLAGTPLITSNLPGVRACVRLTGCGEIVAIKDSVAIASAIKRVTKKFTIAEEITDRAKQHFGSEKTLNWYQAFVSTV